MRVRLTLPGNPGTMKKNNGRIGYKGSGGFCKCCKRPLGQPFVVAGSVPGRLARSVEGAAFSEDVKPTTEPVMAGVLARWPRRWGPKGRAEGRPMGDVDAPISAILDVLSGVLYQDDAQVAVLVAANAIASKGGERVEVSVCELSPRVLEVLTEELGLDFDSAQLYTGRQEGLDL